MNIRQALSVAIIFVSYIGATYGQSDKRIFLGIQPAITIEPFYDEGELDINLFPIIFEAPITSRANLRIAPIANYHLGGITNGVSDLSLFTVLPVFFKKTENQNDKPYGFYIGPVLGFGRNIINNHYTTTLAFEPGYMFEAKRSFTITLGVQFGASYFAYDIQPNKWTSHFGPKVTFGFWLNGRTKDVDN
ncbi:hypothetical protein ACFLRU_05490 [Bacteroidota bacterium]